MKTLSGNNNNAAIPEDCAERELAFLLYMERSQLTKNLLLVVTINLKDLKETNGVEPTVLEEALRRSNWFYVS